MRSGSSLSRHCPHPKPHPTAFAALGGTEGGSCSPGPAADSGGEGMPASEGTPDGLPEVEPVARPARLFEAESRGAVPDRLGFLGGFSDPDAGFMSVAEAVSSPSLAGAVCRRRFGSGGGHLAGATPGGGATARFVTPLLPLRLGAGPLSPGGTAPLRPRGPRPAVLPVGTCAMRLSARASKAKAPRARRFAAVSTSGVCMRGARDARREKPRRRR